MLRNTGFTIGVTPLYMNLGAEGCSGVGEGTLLVFPGEVPEWPNGAPC